MDSSTPKGPDQEAKPIDQSKSPVESRTEAGSKPASQPFKDGTTSSSETNRSLLERLPHLGQLHRPTREELLAAATGFWSRSKVRFKWFSIRSLRPFNADDISAFFSWFLVGHVIWIILGTTTFVSLGIFTLNTVFAQETIAGWVGNYLTKSLGIKVVFESAIVPNWRDGVISFKNVFVTRRPGLGKSKVAKGSPATAAAVAAISRNDDDDDLAVPSRSETNEEEEDLNYTQFDLTLGTINVTLSFAKFFNGKGLLRDVDIQGVRGVVDRTNLKYGGEYIDPRSYKHEHNPGDFELDSFKLEDLLVTVHQPGGFRPFPVSIFACDLPQLRKQWLFYDFLSANTVSGSFDESLFTIHPRQTHGLNGSALNNTEPVDGIPNPWKKHSRLRIDNLSLDHLNRGVHGPLSWIQEGNVDIVADVMFPADNDESLVKVMSDVYDKLEAKVSHSRYLQSVSPLPHTAEDESSDSQIAKEVKPTSASPEKRFLVMDMRVNLNDVRATVPLFTKDLSYVNNALIRPIVVYINSRRTFIPITCRLVKRASDFDGSWTLFDSGLMEDLSAETYDAFARNVADEQARKRRLKKVGLWSLQLAIQALFMGMAGNIA
ncbi:MAG: Mitochondrial distribution and morphology protein 31, mitochondrial precursor [Vezdaea aestivalis]|nr:MAG: Mitochondrial distribution and morphology protein 31, mitochondrial precursor [Vezdaea aestivalis]